MICRSTRPFFWLFAVMLLLTACGGDAPDVADAGTADLEPMVEPWYGDLDGMVERRQIRVLVPFSKTFYFLDSGGHQRGLSFDFMESFEKWLNEQRHAGLLRTRVVYIPVTRDRLIPWLMEGRGDVIAANLTITERRQEQVAFTAPIRGSVNEVLVSGPDAAPLDSLDDLAGRTVFVRKNSSYFDSLKALNESLRSRDLQGLDLEIAPGHFETGDVLEMVNSGLVDHAVSDDYLASFWSQVLPDIEVHDDLIVREGAAIAFAVRPESPELKQQLDGFLDDNRAGTLFGNMTFKRYLENTSWVLDEQRDRAMQRFREMSDLFREYGQEYELDWLMLVAQGYQESQLDQSARSSAGAVGVMQLLPSTASDLGIGDITELENNINAGAHYLRWMIDRYYAGEEMDAEDRLLFALASYNAGPRRVRELRRDAEAAGLDRNVWFDNVEHIAAREIGRETVDYVSNIFKYHIAFRLIAKNSASELLRDES